MPDPWTGAWEEAIASVPKNIVQLEALELIHPAFGADSVRVVNQPIDYTFKIEDTAPLHAGTSQLFVGCPFSFDFPNSEEGRAPECTVRVDNIAQIISQYLDAAEGMFAVIQCIYRVYLSNDLTIVALGPFNLNIREVQENGSSVEGKASLATIHNLRFMRHIYSADEYPSLANVQ